METEKAHELVAVTIDLDTSASVPGPLKISDPQVRRTIATLGSIMGATGIIVGLILTQEPEDKAFSLSCFAIALALSERARRSVEKELGH